MKSLINKKESTRYPGLFVKKYSNKVFFDNLWHTDDSLIEARGHVENATGDVVIKPLSKIFNRFENDTDIELDEQCLWVQKINGFMAAATYVPDVDEVVVSTTGSLDSDFVRLAEKYITPEVKAAIKFQTLVYGHKATWIFEICDPEDPHIIAEPFGMYLLGMRDLDNEYYFSTCKYEQFFDHVALAIGAKRPEWDLAEFSDIVNKAKTCKHEGFVVYGQESKTALKIKSPYYLTLKLLARKKDVLTLNMQKVDEEYYSLIAYVHANIEQFNALDEQGKLEFMKAYINS